MSQKMSRAEIALHGLKAEFMRDAPEYEWFELPGGQTEGMRLPDIEDDTVTMTGCWEERPIEESDLTP